mgnify:CR=1 FL=1
MGFRRNILVKPMVRLMKNSCLENLTEQNRENAGYVWLEQSEVIQIKTKKYTVFMNNKDKDQTTAWYEQLKKAEP